MTHLTRCSSFPDFLIRFLSQKRHLSARNSRDDVDVDVDVDCPDNLRLLTAPGPGSELLLDPGTVSDQQPL